jgi:hypothetical protein
VYYIVGITPVVSAGQIATPSLCTENDLNFDIGSTYPITINNQQYSSNIVESGVKHHQLELIILGK